jgi:hypothetical protein
MKKKSSDIFCFYSICIFGCIKDSNKEENLVEINRRAIKVYTIDSCEYIGNVVGFKTDILTHKGNCKFCLERK